MAERLTTLEAWARARYGDSMPHMNTLRRWARAGKIFPFPKKHGRAYFVKEDARYIESDDELVRAVRESTQTQ